MDPLKGLTKVSPDVRTTVQTVHFLWHVIQQPALYVRRRCGEAQAWKLGDRAMVPAPDSAAITLSKSLPSLSLRFLICKLMTLSYINGSESRLHNRTSWRAARMCESQAPLQSTTPGHLPVESNVSVSHVAGKGHRRPLKGALDRQSWNNASNQIHKLMQMDYNLQNKINMHEFIWI